MAHLTISPLPKHVSIVMDGNGRWAKKKLLPRLAGHHAGLKAVRAVIRSAIQHHIPVLSLFAFSSENWQRSSEEVQGLMNLFMKALKEEIPELINQSVRLRFIGSRERFQSGLIEQMEKAEHSTQDGKALQLLIAADYGGQWDICQAVKQWINEKKMTDDQHHDALTPKELEPYLSFSDLPNPDLFIRTSGEMRLSNFMLWQLAYTELFFTETLWPDFDELEFEKALQFYATRQRRFGK